MPEQRNSASAPQVPFLRRLFIRFLKYTGVGGSTYVLDLCLVALFAYALALDYRIAVALGFLIAVSVNYFVAYHWVYRGTERNRALGYAIFFVIAIGGVVIVTSSVAFLVETYAMQLLLARTLVAGLVGIANFLINTFFNFKLV
jgi:putative flippase GtrA